MCKQLWGKNKKKIGVAPAVALCNPKYSHNIGQSIRAASCFGVKQVWYSGNRITLDEYGKKHRLPREERMKGYKDVELHQFDYFFEQFPKDVTPVAVELREGSEMLTQFEHPEKAVYIFGPEDGSIPSVQLQHCHRFVVIPTRHCVNLSAAVYLLLYDRFMKRQQAGLEPMCMDDIMDEHRGFIQ